MKDYKIIAINGFGDSYFVERYTDENVQSCIDYIHKMIGFETIIIKNTQLKMKDLNNLTFTMSCKMDDEVYKIVKLNKSVTYIGMNHSFTNLEVIG